MMKKKTRTLHVLLLLLSGAALVSSNTVHADPNPSCAVIIITNPDGTLSHVNDGAGWALSHDPKGTDLSATVVQSSTGVLGYAGIGRVQADSMKVDNNNAGMATGAQCGTNETEPVATGSNGDAGDSILGGTRFKRQLVIGVGIIALGLAYWYKDEILTFLGFKKGKARKQDDSHKIRFSSEEPTITDTPEADTETIDMAGECA